MKKSINYALGKKLKGGTFSILKNGKNVGMSSVPGATHKQAANVIKLMMKNPKLHEKPKSKSLPKKGKKFVKIMHEFGAGKLHSGSKHGKIVTNPRQARAIALSIVAKLKK